MGKNWHFLFLVAAFLVALFPPVVTGAGGMRVTTKFTFIFASVDSVGPYPYNWAALFALEAVFLTAFAVMAADRRGR